MRHEGKTLEDPGQRTAGIPGCNADRQRQKLDREISEPIR
jgi:hypothetical protein